jgi:hypothetical protein
LTRRLVSADVHADLASSDTHDPCGTFKLLFEMSQVSLVGALIYLALLVVTIMGGRTLLRRGTIARHSYYAILVSYAVLAGLVLRFVNQQVF